MVGMPPFGLILGLVKMPFVTTPLCNLLWKKPVASGGTMSVIMVIQSKKMVLVNGNGTPWISWTWISFRRTYLLTFLTKGLFPLPLIRILLGGVVPSMENTKYVLVTS